MKSEQPQAAERVPSPGVTGYAPQRWTAEQPAAGGWWWRRWKGAEKGTIIKVTETIGGTFNATWNGIIADVSAFTDWDWAGPLPEPRDAPDAETGHIDGTDRL